MDFAVFLEVNERCGNRDSRYPLCSRFLNMKDRRKNKSQGKMQDEEFFGSFVFPTCSLIKMLLLFVFS